MKYTTNTYTSYFSYTPYDKDENINQKEYTNSIPTDLNTEWGIIKLFDEDNAFAPRVDVYSEFVKNKQWRHCKKSDWYTHLSAGIKVKLEIIRDHRLDYKIPGCGRETRTLTVKIPLPNGRGKNPKSHHNKPSIEGKTRNIKLTDWEWEKLAVLGEGKGYSQGIRNLINSSATSPE